VLVLLGFEKRSYDYVVVKPKELLRRLEAIHGALSRHQVYVWVTKEQRAWLTRELKRENQDQIAQGTFADSNRDLTQYLNDWSSIKDL
jgi:hypothetical protein